MTNNQKFTIMAHNQRYLITKTSEGGNPHVIAECFLEQVAAQICELLTNEVEANLTLENAPKQK
jgi:GTP cyclohydrolase FolE2